MARPAAFIRTLVLCSLAFMAVQATAQHSTKTVVMHPDAFAVSGPVSEMPIMEPSFQTDVLPVRPGPLASHPGAPVKQARGVQTEAGPMVDATLGVSFSGVGANGWAPSDVNLAVGPNHIVQTVNVQFAVYDKTGTLLSGPTNFTTFFSTLGGACAAGSSDPIVNYDRQADRWVISDVGIGSSTFSECYGVSKTNDPTGAYFLYSFSFGTTVNDYPKIGVWPTTSNSAYLSSFNLFANSGNTYDGVDLCGFDRTKALAGDTSAALLCSQLGPSTNEFSYLPSDMDGPTAPADGTPGLFLSWFNNNPGQLHLFKLTMDFSSGTTSLSGPTVISVANDNLACNSNTNFTCVPQSGTTQLLDTLGDFRLMYRFPVRHFADHDRAVANHAVANGSQVAIRWYEIYDPAGSVTLNQQGVYAPDSTYRWMGSMAEDQSADIAIGYSASSSSIHPAIRFTGRVSSDPNGTLETEASILEGTGSQTGGLSRWGDYTAMQVDPTDDCTFWYTNQYEPANGNFNWATNIASFKFSACGADFTWENTGSGSHTVLAGQSSLNYTFHAAPAAPATTFANTVTFSCSFVPSDPTLSASSCTFNPTSIAAGQPAQDVTLSILSVGPNSGPGPSKPQLRRQADRRRRAPWLPFALPIAGVVFAAFAGRKVSKCSAVAGLCVSLVLLGLLMACGGGGGSNATPSSPPQVSVTINPRTPVNLYANETGNQWPAPQTQSYTATVSNSNNTAVTWTLSQNGTDCTTNPACGSLSATTGSPVTYTAPTAVPNPAAVTVKAISQADTTKSASGTVNILQPTAVGSYTVTVTATEGSISHSQQVTLVVQ